MNYFIAMEAIAQSIDRNCSCFIIDYDCYYTDYYIGCCLDIDYMPDITAHITTHKN